MILSYVCVQITFSEGERVKGSQGFKYINLLIVFNRLVPLRIGTTIVAILKQRFEGMKVQNGCHVTDLV